jgi:hypothetical protein
MHVPDNQDETWLKFAVLLSLALISDIYLYLNSHADYHPLLYHNSISELEILG